jgi:hypothetical protein
MESSSAAPNVRMYESSYVSLLAASRCGVKIGAALVGGLVFRYSRTVEL